MSYIAVGLSLLVALLSGVYVFTKHPDLAALPVFIAAVAVFIFSITRKPKP